MDKEVLKMDNAKLVMASMLIDRANKDLEKSEWRRIPFKQI